MKLELGRFLTFFSLGFLGVRVLLNFDILTGIAILTFTFGLALYVRGR